MAGLVGPIRLEAVCCALLYWRQGHVVAVGALKIVFVTCHRLVHFPLEQYVHAAFYVFYRHAAFGRRAGFRKVCHGRCGFAAHRHAAQQSVKCAHGDGQQAVAPEGQGRLEIVARGDFAPPYFVYYMQC